MNAPLPAPLWGEFKYNGTTARQAILSMWRKGFNTASIADRYGIPEHRVDRVISGYLDAKHPSKSSA